MVRFIVFSDPKVQFFFYFPENSCFVTLPELFCLSFAVVCPEFAASDSTVKAMQVVIDSLILGEI
jgi:hypothetical protein